MTDTDAAIRAWLAASAGVTAIAGARIYASRSLPAGYEPEKGPALLFSARGGGQDHSSKVLKPSYQFQSYAATEASARSLDRAVYDAMNDREYQQIKSARLETFPQTLVDQETGWPFVLTYYQFLIGNP